MWSNTIRLVHLKTGHISLFTLSKGESALKTGLLIAADLYGCAEDALERDTLNGILAQCAERNHMHLKNLHPVPEDETGYSLYCICLEGHIILHVNTEKGFVAIDGFSYHEEADPEKLVRELCSFLSPDKMKLTYVDRGDYGKKADMKPRHRNKTRKITQMRNMTKRFGKFLMKPKSL